MKIHCNLKIVPKLYFWIGELRLEANFHNEIVDHVGEVTIVIS